ncbi:MAG: hypothetical protein QXU62_02835 [Thermofilaceae archaeon]
MIAPTSGEKERRIVERLMDWHSKNARKFPWRETRDPFKILIAEILLQRTRAEQVEPIYRKFVEKYPSPSALRGAPLDEVEALIRPLGLAKRGKMLKELAEQLVVRYGGRVPSGEADLMRLKGVGYYAANAVRCLAFGEDVAVVDWNVARFARRVWGYGAKRAPHTDRNLMAFMTSLVPKGRGREFNLALLDFTALVCKPRDPDCAVCPIRELCGEGAAGGQV